jgi:hypothetical protein
MKLALMIGAFAIFFSFNSFCTESTEFIESVKDILRAVEDTDQKTRKEIGEKSKIYQPNSPEIRALWDKQNKIDIENQKIVSDILDKHGWPKVSEYGNLGPAQAVFLVIQHADLEYQKRYYMLLKNATESGDLNKGSFALLEDRIRISEGKKQLYGSQVKVGPNGGKSFYPIKDEVNVDKRRKTVGLPPLAEYAKIFDMVYVPVKN